MEHKVELTVPFDNIEHARAVHDSLSPDPDLKPSEFCKRLELQDNGVLLVHFEATTVRSLRVGVNSFMDVLQEALECISLFA